MSDIMTALGWINDVIFVSLVNTILQMTILISVVALFIWVFRIRTPTMRYSLWLFVLFAVITLPLLTPFVSQIDFARFHRQGVTGDGSDGRPMMESTYAGELSEVSGVLPSESAAKAAVSSEMDVSPINPVSIAYFIWLAVMLFMLSATVVAYIKLRKLRTCSPDVEDGAALAMLSQLKRRIGVRKSVALKASSGIYTPMSLGIFSTVIIVPSSVMDDGSRDELEMILAHELAHIKRYDYLVNFLQNTMRAIFFFHPLFHLMNRGLTKEREHICDDWVIDITKQRNGYARCIVSLLERVAYRPVNPSVTIAMAERKRDIPERIDMIVDRRRRIATRVSRKALFAVLLIGCLSLPIVGGIELIGLAGMKTASHERSRALARAQVPEKPQIAFASYRDGNWEIYAMDAEGKNPRRLTNNVANDTSPDWSPDGQRIAFISNRDGNDELYVMDADGKNPRRLTNHPGWDGGPSWSPDGQRIAFGSYRDGNWEIYAMDADGDNQRNLTNNPANDCVPSWSPDGQRIAFTSKRDGGNFEIYVMDADGKNQRNLTNSPAEDNFPTWSPGGQGIAFGFVQDGNFEIYVMDADGKNPRRLTNNVANDTFPSWSPDGQRIAFVSDRDGDREIYVMDADGNNLHNLTNNPAEEGTPDWFDPAFAYAVSPAGKLKSTWGEIKSLLSPR